MIEMEEKKADEWQWWRISFSADDAKTQQAAKSENKKARNNKLNNADVIGYTAIKVREIEVLKAARESRSLLLVYANANAMAFPHNTAPPALQVRKFGTTITWLGLLIANGNCSCSRNLSIQITLVFRRSLMQPHTYIMTMRIWANPATQLWRTGLRWILMITTTKQKPITRKSTYSIMKLTRLTRRPRIKARKCKKEGVEAFSINHELGNDWNLRTLLTSLVPCI